MANKKISIDPKAWLNSLSNFFKNFPKLPTGEKIAWIAIAVGIILILVGLML